MSAKGNKRSTDISIQGDAQPAEGDSGENRDMSGQLQQTEIGEFPSAWEIARVDSAFDIQQGKQVSSRNRAGEHQRPFLRTKNVFWNRLELADLDAMHFSEAEQSRLELRANDLLVCEGGSIGRTALWNNEVDGCLYQNHLHRLRSKGDKANPQFTVYWLWYAFDVAKLYFGRGNITTIPNLSQSKLVELPMAFPSLLEQKRIAHILSTVQRAIEAQERIIQTTTELKKALMHKLFTEGLRHEPQKQTEIGPVPESWAVTTIGDVTTVKGGKRLSKGDKLVERDTGFPYIRVTDLNEFSVDVRGLLFLTEEAQRPISRYIINRDDVYISIAGSIGITGMIPPELDGANLTENAARLIANDQTQLPPRFLMYWLASHHCQAEIKAQTVKNAQPKLALARIKSLKMPLPSRDEQIEIARALDLTGCKTENARAKRTQLQDLFRTLLHELMTAKTRVHELEIGKDAVA